MGPRRQGSFRASFWLAAVCDSCGETPTIASRPSAIRVDRLVKPLEP